MTWTRQSIRCYCIPSYLFRIHHFLLHSHHNAKISATSCLKLNASCMIQYLSSDLAIPSAQLLCKNSTAELQSVTQSAKLHRVLPLTSSIAGSIRAAMPTPQQSLLSQNRGIFRLICAIFPWHRKTDATNVFAHIKFPASFSPRLGGDSGLM